MTDAPLIRSAAIELCRARWAIGALLPEGTKVNVGAVRGGDTERLMEQLKKSKLG
ncbi:hypothetical protein [Sphingomonas sp. ERG5]|uniref:hypothetical protein n=1 Tax=Sphingomonas sp. ERG5 TaxID=1381597 RepID=UPI001364D52A|nr:hypothetical protein [Sphingomonas sp. ERG5]